VRPLRHIEHDMRNVRDRSGVVLEDLARLLHQTPAVELRQCVLKIAEARHTIRGANRVSKTPVQLEGPFIFPGLLGTPCRGFDIAGELVRPSG